MGIKKALHWNRAFLPTKGLTKGPVSSRVITCVIAETLAPKRTLSANIEATVCLDNGHIHQLDSASQQILIIIATSHILPCIGAIVDIALNTKFIARPVNC